MTRGSDMTRRKAFATRSGDAPADVQEVRGLAAGVLDQVHRCHRQPGAVHDAPDLTVQADVAETVLGGLHLPRILLRVVTELVDRRATEQGVVVEGHLGVERQDVPGLGYYQRVDLHHRGVQVAECPVGAVDGGHRALDLLARESQSEGQLTGLKSLDANRGLDDLLDDRVREVWATRSISMPP